jgi:PAS domain S-box-containing protein
VEARYRRKDGDGRERELSLIMYPIQVPGEGKSRYFMEIARDETRYRTLIEELRGSRKRFRSILDTATNAILSIDENHRITLFNNAAERIFGYARDEVMGEDLGVLIPAKYGDHRRYVQRFLERRQGSLVGRTVSLTALRKDGEEIPVELSLSFLEMESGVTITAIIRDITDRKHLEKKLLQSERLAAVGEAVAHVVHELKNPLMIIGGFTSQIRNAVEDERSLQKLGMILEEVARVERLVGELGDFTKEYRLVRRQADINSVLRDVVKFMGAAYPEDLYSFEESLAPDLGEVLCDPDKLKQVFINIVTNGIEAMSKGGVITLHSERIPHGIEVRISDQGRGIPEKDLQQIFEPFFTTRERGSGLGLAISYKIVQAHGGEISALNRPGKGATFVIRIPRM